MIVSFRILTVSAMIEQRSVSRPMRPVPLIPRVGRDILTIHAHTHTHTHTHTHNSIRTNLYKHKSQTLVLFLTFSFFLLFIAVLVQSLLLA
jgi:hypothetical protein